MTGLCSFSIPHKPGFVPRDPIGHESLRALDWTPWKHLCMLQSLVLMIVGMVRSGH